MRCLAAAAVALAALAAGGCFQDAGDRGPNLGDDDSQQPGGDVSCVEDADCRGAGASCCGCAEYAVNVESEWAMACEDIECPPPTGACTGLVARCDPDEALCVLGCAEVACDQTCPDGFMVDAAGCLTCSCAFGTDVPECEADTDCVRVPADCCGCANGGTDTAIPAADVGDHEAELDCDADPVCPGVDVCEPGVAAVCDRGACVLAAESDGDVLPPGACGTADLPPCPDGQTCVLNSDDAATMAGVGICQ
jgi:hypothetical protein